MGSFFSAYKDRWYKKKAREDYIKLRLELVQSEKLAFLKKFKN